MKANRRTCGTAQYPGSGFTLIELLVVIAIIAILPQANGAPKITIQPRNTAVQLGQNAQFQVTATGRSPSSYQWHFEGVELAGATNRTLAVTNVALSNLGRYDVIVRDSGGATPSDSAWLLLASRWTELVVFGASQDLQRCDGLAWPDYLANQLGVRLRNYAEDGARNSQVLAQITRYLNFNKPTTNTLIAHWLGGSWIDLRFGRTPEWAASNRLASVRLLVNAGAKSLLLPTGVPAEMVPFWVVRNPNFTSEQVIRFDTLMSEGLRALHAESDVTIYRPDLFAWFMALQKNPAAYGFGERLGSNFTCDTAHFTTAVNRFVSQEDYQSLTMPVEIAKLARTPDGHVTFHWSGGSPPFRLERTTDLLSRQWESHGEPAWLPSATVKLEGAHEFFRVLWLGQ